MRLNRGTLALIAVLVVVIAAVLVISNQQASAPAPTATPNTATGPLLPGVAGENIVRYEVRDNTSGKFIALTKDAGGAWHIDATSALDGRDPDQSLINTTVGQIATINYNNVFQDDQLTTFGLDHPAYTILVTTNDNEFHTIYIGAKSPTSARYYAIVQQFALAAATSEATTEPGTFDVQPGEAIPTLALEGQNQNESGVLPPDADATAEATAEATAGVSSKRIVQAAQAATEEPTSEATVEATSDAMMEATAEATPEATVEATEDIVQSPGVTLEGEQTVYLIPQTVIDTLKRWLDAPPYAPMPTAAPTLSTTVEPTAPPLLELPQTLATSEATAEATEAATAAP